MSIEIINNVKIPLGSTMLEPRALFDKAICGFSRRVLYDYDTLLEIVMEWTDCSYEEAADYLSCNTSHDGTFFMGEDSPRIVGEVYEE